MESPLKVRKRSKRLKIKALLYSTIIVLVVCALPGLLMMLLWSKTKFPPQLFGNNEDHFRAHVINPIPQSVEILNVEFDDLIVHPDVMYYFRFLANRSDLEKIISYRTLSPTDEICSGSSYPPEWWDVMKLENVEKYTNDDGNFSDLLITLCYHVPSKTVYFMFLTY